MYMLQHYDKARQRLLEIKARDERRMKLAVEAGMTPEELALLEKEVSESRDADKTEDAAEEPAEKPKPAAKKKPKPAAKKKTKAMMSFDDESDDDDPF